MKLFTRFSLPKYNSIQCTQKVLKRKMYHVPCTPYRFCFLFVVCCLQFPFYSLQFGFVQVSKYKTSWLYACIVITLFCTYAFTNSTPLFILHSTYIISYYCFHSTPTQTPTPVQTSTPFKWLAWAVHLIYKCNAKCNMRQKESEWMNESLLFSLFVIFSFSNFLYWLHHQPSTIAYSLNTEQWTVNKSEFIHEHKYKDRNRNRNRKRAHNSTFYILHVSWLGHLVDR